MGQAGGAPGAHGVTGLNCFRVPGASVPARWTFLQAADVQTTPMLPSALTAIPHCSCPFPNPNGKVKKEQFKRKIAASRV